MRKGCGKRWRRGREKRGIGERGPAIGTNESVENLATLLLSLPGEAIVVEGSIGTQIRVLQRLLEAERGGSGLRIEDPGFYF